MPPPRPALPNAVVLFWNSTAFCFHLTALIYLVLFYNASGHTHRHTHLLWAIWIICLYPLLEESAFSIIWTQKYSLSLTAVFLNYMCNFCFNNKNYATPYYTALHFIYQIIYSLPRGLLKFKCLVSDSTAPSRGPWGIWTCWLQELTVKPEFQFIFGT